MSKFTVEIEVAGQRLEVHGSASREVPARTNCANEDATPAEGGLEEITMIRLLVDQGKIRVNVTDLLESQIDSGDYDEAILKALEDCAEAGKADREEQE